MFEAPLYTVQCFEHGDAIEMCNRITFDFYTGLPFIVPCILNWYAFVDLYILNWTSAYYTVHFCGLLHTIMLYISVCRCTQWPKMVP